VFKVKKVDKQLDLLEVKETELSTGELLYYHDLKDVISLLVKNSDLTKNWIGNAPSNVDSVSHYSNSKMWERDFEACSKQMKGADFVFLSVIAFVDGYQRERFSHSCCDAIYCTLANFSVDVLMKKAAKVLLCSASPSAPKQEVYKVVLVDPIMQLESGMLKSYFYPANKVVTFCGTLHAVLGDDIALRGVQVIVVVSFNSIV
jgi:hypothetical protein